VNLGTRLEPIIGGSRGEDLRRAALNCNVPFAPEGYRHGSYPYSTSSRDSVFIRRLFDPLEWGPEHFAEADALWNWLSSNVYLPRELRKEIELKRRELKTETLKRTK
jgi:hypothetical protein